MTGWHANIVTDVLRRFDRLFLYREGPDRQTEVIVGFDEYGVAVTKMFDPDLVPDFNGFVIPREALMDLADRLKPGPASQEVARLEDALAVERRRVDDVLNRTVRDAAP